MRARRSVILGGAALAAYVAAMAWVSYQAVTAPDLAREVPAQERRAAAEDFVAAWQRSREATFVTTGTYERHSEVTGSSLSSEDVVAQRPPRRVHRQLGGVDGRDDDRLIVCPAPPAGQEEEAAPCRLGPPGGLRYDEAVAREVAGIRSVTSGADALYTVTRGDPGCFDLEQRRVDPRAPFGVAASFCFDAATGAPTARRVRHEGGIVEVLAVTAIRATVTDADLDVGLEG